MCSTAAYHIIFIHYSNTYLFVLLGKMKEKINQTISTVMINKRYIGVLFEGESIRQNTNRRKEIKHLFF